MIQRAAAASDSSDRSLLSDQRLWLMGLLGVASGLALPLSGFTFRLWLARGGVSLALIGLTANAGLAYSLKFLWAPVLDRVAPPWVFARLGRRRGWLALIQGGLALGAAGLAAAHPRAAPGLAIAAAACVAFLSASQDIVIDAWRIETFPPRAQGAAMAAYVWGYRIALLIAGAGVIAASAHVGWHLALGGVAALLALAPLVTLAAPEPADTPRPRGAGLRGAVLVPLRDLLGRPGAITILGFVALFKLGEAMAGVMTAPFYTHLGFDRAAIAVANGPLALACAFAGTALGGFLVARLGVGRALLATGWVQTLTMGMYLVLAASAGHAHVLVATVAIEAFAEGMADAAFITYLSGLCAPGYAATQYALLSSLAAIGLRTVGGLSGFLAAATGWTAFYALAMFAALPAMGLMLRLLRRYPPAERRGA